MNRYLFKKININLWHLTIISISLLMIILFHPNANICAATYYVSTSGNDSALGTQSSPWRSIQKAANSALAGDTVIVQPGNYGEKVNSVRSGNSGNYITYQASGEAIITKFNISHDWIKIVGLTFSGCTIANDGSIWLGGNNVEILNNKINKTTNDVYGIVTKTTKPYVDNILIKGNTFDGLKGHNVAVWATNSLIENNVFKNSYMDALRVWGHDIRINGNLFTGFYVEGNNHPDFIQTFGTSGESYNIIFENNRGENSYCQPCNLSEDENPDVRDWTFRNNVFYNLAGTANIGIRNVKFYNNTFYKVGYASSYWAIGFLKDGRNWNGDNGVVMNNIFINDVRANVGWYTAASQATLTADYNYVASEAPGYGAKAGFFEAHGINGGDPKFVNVNYGNFHLLSTSPAVDPQNGSANLSASGFRTDKDGVVRPQGSRWDLGAYEYRSSSLLQSPENFRLTNQ